MSALSARRADAAVRVALETLDGQRHLEVCPGAQPTHAIGHLTWDFTLERVTRIELALSAWEADVLPLNYTRAHQQWSVVAATEPACAVFAQTSYRTR
jgi:hypothetical protein